MTARRGQALAAGGGPLARPWWGPLRARDVSREQITPVEGLSALSLDVLTSIAYGPEAILAVAGAGALRLVLPITAAIVVLLGAGADLPSHPRHHHAAQPARPGRCGESVPGEASLWHIRRSGAYYDVSEGGLHKKTAAPQ